MENPHNAFFNFHQYLISIRNLIAQARGQFEYPQPGNLLMYSYTHSLLYSYYLVFSNPSIETVFSEGKKLNMALKIAQYHMACVEFLEKRNYVLQNQFVPGKLPNLQEFFLGIRMDLNTEYQLSDIFKDGTFINLFLEISELVLQQFEFVKDFCYHIRVVDSEFNTFLQHIRDQIQNALNMSSSDENLEKLLFDLLQSLVFTGIPFLPSYETYAWVPRELGEVLMFERFIGDEYLDAINKALSADQKEKILAWIESNQNTAVEIPAIQESMGIIDVIFLQAMHIAVQLYNYNQIDQIVSYLQARFELEKEKVAIIMGKYYDPPLHDFIDNFISSNQEGIIQLAIQPPATIPLAKIKEIAEPPAVEQASAPPSPEPNVTNNITVPASTPLTQKVTGDPVFMKTAGDFRTPPVLAEIERVLKIIKGENK